MLKAECFWIFAEELPSRALAYTLVPMGSVRTSSQPPHGRVGHVTFFVDFVAVLIVLAVEVVASLPCFKAGGKP